jgi:small conductance mechanosensitive channel
MKRGISFFVLLLTGLLLSQVLWGGIQDDRADEQDFLEGVDVDSIGDHAAGLVSSVRAEIDLSHELQARLAGAGREDSLVLELRLVKLRLHLISDIHDLADIVISLEEKGSQEELRVEVEKTLEYLTPQLWKYIERRENQIDAARNRRHSIDVQDRPELEDDIAVLTLRLDEAFEFSLVHVEKLEKLEMESSEARETLIGLLADRAADLSGRIDLALERVDRMAARLTDTPDNSDLPILIVATHKSLGTNTGSLTATLHIMDALKIPTEDYRAQLAEATRDISTVILDRGAAASLISSAMGRLWSWLADTGPGLIVKLALFIGLIYLFRFLSRLARKGTTRALDSANVDVSTLLRRMIITAAANVVMVLGLLIALSQLGINLGPLLAGLGVVGFIIGFALQDTLSNFAAGMMILIYRPYDVGDMVDVGTVFGKVNKMSLVSTTILTIDNQTIIIPNSKIWSDVIKNVTAQDLRRVDMTFGISYTDDIPKAEQVLMGILQGHDKILDDPEPAVKLHELGDSSVNFVVRPWVKVDDYWDVYWDVTRAVKMRFDEEGVSIPFPQRDVHIYNDHIDEEKKEEKVDDV